MESSNWRSVTPKLDFPPHNMAPSWFDRYQKRNIVALDVFCVYKPSNNTPYETFIKKNEKGESLVWFETLNKRRRLKMNREPSEITVVDYTGFILDYFRVKHDPMTFSINDKTNKKLRYTSESLRDGRPYDEIKEKLIKLLKGKLVIAFSAENDFKALHLNIKEFDVFDIQSYFFEWTNRGKQHPYELKELMFYYFQQRIQKEKKSTYENADATMKLFRDIYCATPKRDRDFGSGLPEIGKFFYNNRIKPNQISKIFE